jgi:hypothetical protein
VTVAEKLDNGVEAWQEWKTEGASMSYTDFQNLSAAEFKRLCGVSHETFNEMVEVLRPDLERQGRRGGQNKLSVEDQLLVTLEYWREYRTQFHIATSRGLHETTVSHIIRKVEDVLVKCGRFRLPSKRHLYQPGWEWKVFMVDVGEIEIERPKKKTKTLLLWQAEMSHHEVTTVS